EAERLCDRVAIVDHGRVIKEGTPGELIASLGAGYVLEFEVEGEQQPDEKALRQLPAVTGVRRDQSGWALSVTASHRTMPLLTAHLGAAGLSLARIATRQATLEDVFVDL